ncbi:MAG TPA: DUF2934 domain-containing protein [Nitrospirales bacterium]|jgi:hypothetical protein
MAKKQSSSQGKSGQSERRPAPSKTRPSELSDPELSQSSENGHGSQTVEFNTQIARKAYELFLRRGGESGRDVEDWLEAERLVRQEQHPENR